MSTVAYILNAILIAIFFFNIAYICLINILSIYFDLQHSKTKFRPLIRNYHSNPLVTVVVPAWNEEVGLNKTLESIVSSTYKKIQIIVVDDGSKDNTLSKALEFQKKYKSNDDSHIIVITQQNKGKAEAINTALEKVEGKYVFTVDADSYLSKEAIGECVYSMQKNNADAVSGRIIVGNTDNFYGLMQYYEFLFTFLLKKSQHITNSIYVITGALAGFKTSTLKSIGKFNGETKGEDLDITLRFQIAQKRLIYSNDAILVTEGPSSFGLLVKQRTRWKFCTYKTLGLVLSKIATDFKNRNLSFFSLSLKFQIL
jgi:biofilm PGA synthesis N-glycosyltransferase PgaC